MLGPTNIPFDQVGAISTAPTLSVTAAAIQSHTITSGKKGVILQIVSGSECWFGGSDIDPTTNKGNIMTPRMMLIFRNAKSTFKVYFKCAAGKTAEVGINEID